MQNGIEINKTHHICVCNHFCSYSLPLWTETCGLLRPVIFTVRLHVTQCTVLLSQFCLSVRCVYCHKTTQSSVNILTPDETWISLVFPLQRGLLGIVPFHLKYLPKSEPSGPKCSADNCTVNFSDKGSRTVSLRQLSTYSPFWFVQCE